MAHFSRDQDRRCRTGRRPDLICAMIPASRRRSSVASFGLYPACLTRWPRYRSPFKTSLKNVSCYRVLCIDASLASEAVCQCFSRTAQITRRTERNAETRSCCMYSVRSCLYWENRYQALPSNSASLSPSPRSSRPSPSIFPSTGPYST